MVRVSPRHRSAHRAHRDQESEECLVHALLDGAPSLPFNNGSVVALEDDLDHLHVDHHKAHQLPGHEDPPPAGEGGGLGD